jgi:hypothetical protein
MTKDIEAAAKFQQHVAMVLDVYVDSKVYHVVIMQ